LVGRFLVGLAVGFNNISSPVLLSEIAPKEVRGQFTTMHQLGVTVGILASGVAGYGLVSTVTQGWRYLFALGLVCPVLQFSLGWAFLPESPLWLSRNGRRDAAVQAYVKLSTGAYTRCA
jgi:MFS family permease